MGSINNRANTGVHVNEIDIGVTDETKSSASRRNKGSQMSSGGTSSTKCAVGVPPPIDKYDSSKLKTYGSFPFDFLTNITKEWKCAYSLLPIKEHNPKLELGRWESDVLVLKCGHFIHAECKVHFMESETTTFKCSQCQEPLLQKECSELPIANHLLDLRSYLNQRGIACSDCHSNPPKVFAPDLMYVCMECTNFTKLNESLKEEKHQKPIFMDNCPKGIQVLTNGVERQLSGDLQVIRICLFCRTKKEGDHFNHPLKRISSITVKECELIHKAWINTKKEQAKPGTEYRLPWHVVMVDFNWIFKILTEYFQCCCEEEYDSSRTTVSNSSNQYMAVRPSVNIVKCAHLSCNSCWKKILESKKKTCLHKDCKEQLLMGSKQRYVKDLEFISKRKLNDYERCKYCDKHHPKEFMRSHTTEDKKNIEYCAFCFDHLVDQKIISISASTS